MKFFSEDLLKLINLVEKNQINAVLFHGPDQSFIAFALQEIAKKLGIPAPSYVIPDLIGDPAYVIPAQAGIQLYFFWTASPVFISLDPRAKPEDDNKSGFPPSRE